VPEREPEDLDDWRLRVDDPGLGDPGEFVEGELLPAVPFFRPFGEDIHPKFRSPFDVLLSDEGKASFRDSHQIRFDRPERIVGGRRRWGRKKPSLSRDSNA
jgi:hypothetical protein